MEALVGEGFAGRKRIAACIYSLQCYLVGLTIYAQYAYGLFYSSAK